MSGPGSRTTASKGVNHPDPSLAAGARGSAMSCKPDPANDPNDACAVIPGAGRVRPLADCWTITAKFDPAYGQH
jgi:hypothetical protein